ncbi:MAG: penicillin-binding protein 2 [Alphaproteobacteria bacterium]|jgi:penicillin-binding protein 2|nr:penicillin-binding protein 2 [Alphaproteobacteria bacterium]
MAEDSGRYKSFTRRALLIGGTQAALLAALSGRLYYLQVVRSDQYRMLADENRISLRLLAPPRGQILDRDGLVLATNQQNYRVLIIPEQTKLGDEEIEVSLARTLDALEPLIPISDRQRDRIVREVSRKRNFVPVTVVENLTWEEFSRVNVRSPDLPGVIPDVGETRFYPQGASLAHLVGYVALVSENDDTDDPLLTLPGFRIGRTGVERMSDLSLRGKAGASHVEVNAHGRVIRELERSEGQPGADLVLTLDSNLQQTTTARLGNESAGAVVMDIWSGDILAMASTPGFDPNAFNYGLAQDEWDRLVTDTRKPLTNKALSGQYPPGSAFKMIVSLAALEAGIVNPGHRVFCPGEVELGNQTFHCWKRGGHGDMTMTSATEQSCDVYFYDIARRTGIDKISEMAKRFGLGTTVDFGLGVERSGLVPSREWKLARTGERWQVGETLITGIGQGFVLTTPAQLAVMTAQIANGGLRVTPRLIKPADPVEEARVDGGLDVEADQDPRSLGISASAMAVIHGGMDAVVNNPRGTAYRSRITQAGFEMAGKTGTSQVRRITEAEREADRGVNEIPWAERDHAVFVGYAPISAPRYAISVVVEHGGGGASMAAPIAHDVMLEAQRLGAARDRRQAAEVDAPPEREG